MNTLTLALLQQIKSVWTSGNDTDATSSASLTNAQNTTINTLAGNDRIQSSLVLPRNGAADASVSTSTSTIPNAAGTHQILKVGSAISNLGTIQMGAGSDKLLASLSIGTASQPRTTNFLSGASSEFTGFLNGATPNTITFDDPGLPNPQVSAVLSMGTGADEVRGDVNIYSTETLLGNTRVTSPSLGLLPNLRASGITNIGPLSGSPSVIDMGGASGNINQNLKTLSGNAVVQGVTLAAGTVDDPMLVLDAGEISAAGITNLLGRIQSGDAINTISAVAELSSIKKGLTEFIIMEGSFAEPTPP